jgi:hypothetical protein
VRRHKSDLGYLGKAAFRPASHPSLGFQPNAEPGWRHSQYGARGEVPRRLKPDETHASYGTVEAVPLQNLAIIHIIEAQKVTPTSRIVVGWSRSGFIT